MKYTDQQRISKIYENVKRLNDYILENNVSREKPAPRVFVAMACDNSVVQYR